MCGMLFRSANSLAGLNTQASAAKQTAATARNEADAIESEDVDTLATKEAAAVKAAVAAEVVQNEENSQRLQVLLLASATAMLNLVGLVLNVIGLLVPNSSSWRCGVWHDFVDAVVCWCIWGDGSRRVAQSRFVNGVKVWVRRHFFGAAANRTIIYSVSTLVHRCAVREPLGRN